MGRDDLADDPRFATNAARVEHIGGDRRAWCEGWADGAHPRRDLRRHPRATACPRRRCAISHEVLSNAHMHERGMLERIDHPSSADIVVPGSPLRYHGADRVETTPSPRLGQHNDEVYGGWLGLDADEIAGLKRDGVI